MAANVCTDTMVIEDFHPGEVTAQRRWGTPGLWDPARARQLLWHAIPEVFHTRIEAAPFFFLSTAALDGSCDCSFKGGGPGLIRMLATDRMAFPDFDGNGAFMSLGNIMVNPQVGLLLIDFNDGTRLRVNGHASILEGAAAAEIFPDAPRAVLVEIDLAVPNCNRHIPRLVPAVTEQVPA
jgi:hypothetical protein